MLVAETDLTEAVLRQFPKSYWIWNHRTWSLEQMQNPTWKKEIVLCDTLLKMDARNCNQDLSY
jgi:geranylgeranyl transferase type-2 subunit alpha